MANGLLQCFPPNRLATTFPEFHNLKGIPQEKSRVAHLTLTIFIDDFYFLLSHCIVW